jgi:hypothetical protein
VEDQVVPTSKIDHAMSALHTRTTGPGVRACESCFKRWTTLRTRKTWAASMNKGDRVRLAGIRTTGKQRRTGVVSRGSCWKYHSYLISTQLL